MNHGKQNLIDEKIIVQNVSGQPITVSVSAIIGGKTHSWGSYTVGYGDEQILNGEFSKNIDKEFKRAFGDNGKFSKKNQNSVVFVLDFGEFNNSVAIGRISESAFGGAS